MLKIKKGFLLRRLGDEYMAVAIGEASKNFNGMIRLNETGAFYWEILEKGTIEEELLEKTLERYQEVDKETARIDIKDFLNSISIALDDDTDN